MSAELCAPIPTNAAKAQVHSFAEAMAQHLGLSPGQPLEPVVAALDGRISYHAPFSARGSAPPAIVVQPDQSFVIHLPVTTSPQRNRFTIAHEIGHLLLHFPLVKAHNASSGMMATRWVDDSDPIQRRAEWEANWFAAAFLMPSNSFITAAAARGNSASALAEVFDVSEQAARIRGDNLGIKLVS